MQHGCDVATLTGHDVIRIDKRSCGKSGHGLGSTVCGFCEETLRNRTELFLSNLLVFTDTATTQKVNIVGTSTGLPSAVMGGDYKLYLE